MTTGQRQISQFINLTDERLHFLRLDLLGYIVETYFRYKALGLQQKDI